MGLFNSKSKQDDTEKDIQQTEAANEAETVTQPEAAAEAEQTAQAEEAAVEVSEAEVSAAGDSVAEGNAAAITATSAYTEEGYVQRSGGKKPNPDKKTRISYERKKKLYGYAFILLWLLGTIYMFIVPMVESMRYSLSNTEVANATNWWTFEGMNGPGIYCEWNNFKNYVDEFTTDPNYVPNLLSSITAMPGDTFMILVFSLFIALLLNQKFRGRALARAIFFIPVLVATGPVLSVINGDMGSQGVGDASQFSSLFEVDMVDSFLEFMGFANISQSIADQLGAIASDLFNLIWRCGIQTIIFLSALQQIPTAAKEAAQMEGATGWEFFWKITFPTISPMILANLIYTVIDCFIDSANPVMSQVMAKASAWEYGTSAAMAWTYFLIVGVALGIISAIISKFVFYQVD